MPNVKPNESKSSYLNRCISYVVNNEGTSQKQAIGKCNGLWEQHLKRKRRNTRKKRRTYSKRGSN